MQIFTLFDKKAATYLKPQAARNQVEIQRSLMIALEDDRSSLAKWPDEYDIYYVGDFDEDTGKVHPQIPVFLFNVSDLIPKEKGVKSEQKSLNV